MIRISRFLSGICLIAGASWGATSAHDARLSPAAGSLRAGKTIRFSTNWAPQRTGGVEWSLVSPAAEFTGSLGAITERGVYTAPAVPPVPNTVIVRAVNASDRTISAMASLTLLNPVPAIASVTPASAGAIDVAGSGFLAASRVMVDGTPAATRYISPARLQATAASAPAAGAVITVVNPGPGAAASNAVPLAATSAVAVTVTPDGRTLRCGASLAFSAAVANSSDQVVTWQVNGQAGGASATGTISTAGVYTAPSVLPSPAAVTITAVSHADPNAKGSATLNLANAVPAVKSVSPNPVNPGSITITLNGTGFAQGAVVYFAGAPLTTTFVSDTKLTATGTVAMPVGRLAAVKAVNPNPGSATSVSFTLTVRPRVENMPYADAVRFLEMATFGAAPQDVVELQRVGRDAWLKTQFAQTASLWPAPNNPTENVSRLQTAFFDVALHGADQLRQRVAFALAQILVVSATKDNQFQQMAPYQRLMGDSAFGNYRDLLAAITLNPSMGYFLDMVNNEKADPSKGTVANENYAREIMQLFSVGLVRLNPDGTPVLASGATVPEYDQSAVAEMAKVMTGWTYGQTPNFANNWGNPAYYFAPMASFDNHHDATAKNIKLPVPCLIGAGGTAESDLTAALDCLFGQENVAPFVSYRLIQRLVMSGPSPAYVARVASVFQRTHGDLQAVVTAVLTDPEAAAEGTGKLAEPVLYATGLLRALDAAVTASDTLPGQTNQMGQNVLAPPTVFSYFLPDYQLPGVTPAVVAPEFQALNAGTALARANFAWRAVNNGLSTKIKVDLGNLQDLASNPADLVEAVNQALFRGEMDANVRVALLAAANGSTGLAARVRSVLYAAAASPQFQVKR